MNTVSRIIVVTPTINRDVPACDVNPMIEAVVAIPVGTGIDKTELTTDSVFLVVTGNNASIVRTIPYGAVLHLDEGARGISGASPSNINHIPGNT